MGNETGSGVYGWMLKPFAGKKWPDPGSIQLRIVEIPESELGTIPEDDEFPTQLDAIESAIRWIESAIREIARLRNVYDHCLGEAIQARDRLREDTEPEANREDR